VTPTDHDECGEDHDQHDDETHLDGGGLTGSGDVQHGERQGQGDADDPGWEVDHQREVRVDALEGERRLQHQRHPQTDPADRGGGRPDGSPVEVVRPAGPRHCDGQLGHAQDGRHGEETGDQVGERERRAGLGCGDAGEQEEP
jgi:hypothetical protein